jgi:hypothetical protein
MAWPFFNATDREILLENNKLLKQILLNLKLNQRIGVELMADTTALAASLQTLQATVDEAANTIDTLVASGGGASQEQVDALQTAVDAATSTLRTSIDAAALPPVVNPL